MRSSQKARNRGTRGGSEMHAVFLDSGRQDGSTGTGVFLPRTAGCHHSSFSTKPACASILIPARVVEALNINVDELGLQLKPQTDSKKNMKGKMGKLDKKGKDVIDPSPEVFLPKEWTY